MQLLERQAQLDEMTRALRASDPVVGRLMFVTGEAGAGKSALVEEFAAQSERVARTFWGHCDALDTSRALGAVIDIFLAMSTDDEVASRALPPREQLFTRLFEQLSRPGTRSIVALEDLHWADDATLDFVHFLGRRIQRTQCLLICTYRDDEVSSIHPLRRILGDLPRQHTQRLHLPPLSLTAVEQMGHATPHDACRVHEITGGNPFFVREVLSAPPGAVPETVRDAILSRLLQCSPAARELAEVVSLVPGRMEIWLARSLLGDIAAAADETVARGLLRHQGGTLAFRHELGRLAIESSVAPGRAQSLHRAIFSALSERGGDLSRRVHHAMHAQDVDAVLECAPQAARQAAAAGAHREAAAHFAVALRYAARLPPHEHAALLEAHAIETDLTNSTAAAIDSGTLALALWSELGNPEAQARTHRLLERQYWKAGQSILADQHGARAIELLQSLPHGPELAMAYSARSQRAMTRGNTEEALAFAQRAIDLASRFDDVAVRTHALNNIGSALLLSGDEAGLEPLEQSLAIALEHDLQEHAGRAFANLASAAVRHRHSALARRYIGQGLEYCDGRGVDDCLAYIRAWAARWELSCGRWDAAAEAAGDLLECHSLAVAQRIPALNVLAVVRARRGDPGAESLLDEALKLALPTGELQRIGPVAAARAELAWYRGDLERVAQEAAAGLESASSDRDPWVLGELAYWNHRAGFAAETVTGIAEPYALMIAGDWQAAALVWQRLDAPFERALALLDGSKEALLEALQILERLGGSSLGAIVRRRLRALGVRGVPRGQRASTRRNPAGLTSREVQVLAMLVHGHTNFELAQRLHLAPKTVEHHVSSILEKLQVHSRTEAVAAAFGLGIVKSAVAIPGGR